MLLNYLKRGAYNTFTYGASAVFTRIISFFFLPYFLSKLSLEDFGVWDFYQTFFSLGTLILSSCAATSLIRFYLLHKDDHQKQQQAVGNALLFTLVGAFVFPVAVFSFFSFFYPSPLSSKYLSLSIFSISFFSLFSLFLAYLRVKEYLVSYFFVFSGQNIIAIALTVATVAYGFGIDGFFYANCFSFALFFPAFLYLLSRHWNFCLPLFKQQLMYSLPLMVYSILYGFFFSIDRFIIKQYCGYETLGTYGLLWRFGSVFQFLSIALIDASPVVLFNAQKEKNGNSLIAKMITYFCIVVTSGCLITLFGARCAIGLFFPYKYYYLISYLPFFFLPLICLDIARILNAGIVLSTKTIFTPLLTLGALGIQTILLLALKSFGLQGIFLGNALSFALYGLFGYLASTNLYSADMFNKMSILKLSVFFGLYSIVFHILFTLHTHWLFLLLFLATWPVMIWISNIIDPDEKNWLYTKLGQLIENIIKKHSTIKYPTKKPQTIFYIKTDIFSHGLIAGGSVTHTLGVINGFINNGCKVLCACSTLQQEVSNLNINYFQSLKVWPLFFWLRWKIGFLRWHADCFFSTFYFAWQVRNIQTDIIYQRYSWLNWTGLLLSITKKIPLVLEFNGSEVWLDTMAKNPACAHSDHPELVEGRHGSPVIHRLAGYIEYLNLEYADTIIVVSQALKDTLVNQGISQDKILVNPNGVNPEKFNPAQLKQERSTFRSKLRFEDTFVFGFIGTFSFWHGISVLAQIIPKIIHLHNNVHFLLIGDGPMKDNLVSHLKHHKITEKHITFTGILNQKEAKNYLAACDAFLCPTQPNADGSRFFGSPTKLFEYMSLAKPIIASDLEQISEVIKPALKLSDFYEKPNITSQVGFLVNPQSIEEFICASIHVINLSKADQKTIGINARNKILQAYTWDKNTEKTLQHFNSFSQKGLVKEQ